MTEIADIYARQLGIYDPLDHQADEVTFVGCGGIGSFAAFGAAKLGVPHITLIDHDQVEIHNVPNQNYSADQVGQDKVAALASQLEAVAPNTTFSCVPHSLPSDGVDLRGLVVSGLDSMEARTNIWNSCIRMNPAVHQYFDARLSGLYMIVYAVNPCNSDDIEHYEKTLYSDEQAEAIACTERGIIDVGLQIGALLTRNIRRFFNREDVPRMTIMNHSTYISMQGDWIRE